MKIPTRFRLQSLAGALLVLPLTASAAWEGSANVGLTSDYVFRGVSQTDEDPAIQGGFDLGHDSGFYLGTWASNVDFDEEVGDPTIDDAADMELDVYLGFANQVGDISYDISLLRYMYPGADADLDYNELVLAVGYLGFTGTLGYSNDVFASDETGIYYNLAYTHEFAQGFNVSAGIGYYDFDQDVAGAGNPDSYVDYHLGVAKEFAGFGFDLSWFDTNGDGEDLFGDIADSRVVFTVSKQM